MFYDKGNNLVDIKQWFCHMLIDQNISIDSIVVWDEPQTFAVYYCYFSPIRSDNSNRPYFDNIMNQIKDIIGDVFFKKYDILSKDKQTALCLMLK